MDSISFMRASSCHVLTALGSYVTAITCLYYIGAQEDLRISATIGIGFGQISLIAIWLVVGISRVRFWSSAVAVLGCYLAMALWVLIVGSHVDSGFFVSLAIACVVYLFAMVAGMFVVRRLSGVTVLRLSDTPTSDNLSSQYGIRDIMITMSVVALGTAIVKLVGAQANSSRFSQILIIFGLIILSFFILSWPVVVSCLSQRWGRLAVFSIVLEAVVFFAQQPIFNSLLGPGGSVDFLIFLDAPFVLAVAVHSLIARGFGYRLKIVSSSSQE